jgi:hypothetical protein
MFGIGSHELIKKTESGNAVKRDKRLDLTEEQLLKAALDDIDLVANSGIRNHQAKVSRLNPNESFIEESYKKARQMVESGEAEKIAKAPVYKGGE